MAIIKGKWKWNKNAIESSVDEISLCGINVLYTSNNVQFTMLDFSIYGSGSNAQIVYVTSDGNPTFVCDNGNENIWLDEYLVMDFGDWCEIDDRMMQVIGTYATKLEDEPKQYDWFGKLFLDEAKAALSGKGSSSENAAGGLKETKITLATLQQEYLTNYDKHCGKMLKIVCKSENPDLATTFADYFNMIYTIAFDNIYRRYLDFQGGYNDFIDIREHELYIGTDDAYVDIGMQPSNHSPNGFIEGSSIKYTITDDNFDFYIIE